MDWFWENGWILWLALALVFAAVEVATVDLVFLMLAGGAVVAGFASLAGLGLFWETVIGVGAAIALLGVVRPMIRRRIGTVPETPMGVHAQIGRIAVVLATVTEHEGRVKLSGNEWTARVPRNQPPIAAGEEAKVVDFRGATVIVVPVTEG